MSIVEKLDLTIENEAYRETYKNSEKEIVQFVEVLLLNADVACKAYGNGMVKAVNGDNFENVIIDITFGAETKRFSLLHVMSNKFVCFVDEAVLDTLNQFYGVHTELTKKFKELEAESLKLAYETKKKAEATKQAEAKIKKQQEQAIKAFDRLTTTSTPVSATDEFYYALGWLASHVSTISASLPDYLENSFIKHFGNVPTARIVDSKKRTVGGHSMQWTFGFKANLHKADNIPSCLTEYLSSNGKAIADTSFIWNLVDTCGFQFSKKQDVDQIKSKVPEQFVSLFEAGFNA